MLRSVGGGLPGFASATGQEGEALRSADAALRGTFAQAGTAIYVKQAERLYCPFFRIHCPP